MKQQAEAPEGSSALPVDPPAAEGEAALVDGEATDATTPVDFVTESVDYSPVLIGRLIGVGGETIRTLEVRTRARETDARQRRTDGMRLGEKMVRCSSYLVSAAGTVGVDDAYGWLAQAQSGTRIKIDHEAKKLSIAGPAASVAQTLQQVNEMLAAPEMGALLP